MAKNIKEITLLFYKDDYKSFYNELYLYYLDSLNKPRKEDIDDIKILSDIINISDLDFEHKNILRNLIDKIYKLFCTDKKNYEKFLDTDLSLEDSDTLRKMVHGEICLPSSKEKMNFKVNYSRFEYEKDSSNIFTIDKDSSSVFEQAYGIKFDGKKYHLSIYIPDSITFLDNNRTILREAYDRGESIFTSSGKYDMIPYPNIIEYLEFKTHAIRSAIRFKYIFDKNGKLLSYDIDPVTINLSKHIQESKAKDIIKGRINDDGNIVLLKELVDKLADGKLRKFNILKSSKTTDLISFLSIYLNHFIGSRCDKLIFFDGNKYTSNPTKYAFIATPLRKIVSDINIAVFLDNIGYYRLSDKDIGYYFDNKEEIINHLNDRRKLYSFYRKYPGVKIKR